MLNHHIIKVRLENVLVDLKKEIADVRGDISKLCPDDILSVFNDNKLIIVQQEVIMDTKPTRSGPGVKS